MRTINVTANDIKRGQACAQKPGGVGDLVHSCAVALAVKRAYKDSHSQWIFSTGRANGNCIEAVNENQKETVARFVDKHDRILKVKPFKFQAEYTHILEAKEQ